MIIQKIELSLGGQWLPMEGASGVWQREGVTVRVDGDRVSLRADAAPLCGLRLYMEPRQMKNARILGDTWERGYGDLQWLPPRADRVMPWYFLAWDGTVLRGFGVKTLPNALCFWNYDGEQPVLTLDLRSGTFPVELGDRELTACTLVEGTLEGEIHEGCARFCRMLCDHPRMVSRPIFGGNDWYCNYGSNSYEKIRLHARRIARCAEGCTWKPYMVIDDGWQLCHRSMDGEGGCYNGGPWRYANANFGDMKAMAEEIMAQGAIPGIWMRPLQTLEKLPQEVYLRRSGNEMPLDPSHPLVLEKIREDVKTIVSWGYRLIKHDFSCADIFGLWGYQMGGEPFGVSVRFHDRSKTTAEIVKNLYLAIREAAGEEVLIMGCNTMSHLSAGIMDIQRTGDDTSGRDWARTRKYGVNTLAFRMMQHGSFYCVDADCVGLTLDVPWEKNRQWLDVLAKSGTPLFVSIGEDAFSAQAEEAIREAFRHACGAKQVSRPHDWLETMTPEVWQSDFGRDEYTW